MTDTVINDWSDRYICSAIAATQASNTKFNAIAENLIPKMPESKSKRRKPQIIVLVVK
ncbi:hypothetical protein [Brunnivagina elsteri]|uniref:hypothetical protein n=1 Tax=Brunnivagina elsteri TaxID=1247191 RepID=UPI0013043073|nr:hypothetical protein [Calothrix elsteri]